MINGNEYLIERKKWKKFLIEVIGLRKIKIRRVLDCSLNEHEFTIGKSKILMLFGFCGIRFNSYYQNISVYNRKYLRLAQIISKEVKKQFNIDFTIYTYFEDGLE